MENKTLPAPLHHVVGQLRELLIRSDIHTLTPSRHGFEAWDSANECCVLEGSAKAVAVTIAAVNALPALLAIAESAQEMRKVQRQCAYDASICAAGRTYSDETRISLEQDLDMALSSLPNPQPSAGGEAAPLHAVVGPCSCGFCQQCTGDYK